MINQKGGGRYVFIILSVGFFIIIFHQKSLWRGGQDKNRDKNIAILLKTGGGPGINGQDKFIAMFFILSGLYRRRRYKTQMKKSEIRIKKEFYRRFFRLIMANQFFQEEKVMRKLLVFAAAVALCGQFLFAGGRKVDAGPAGVRSVTVVVPSMGPVPRGRPEVEAAVNEIIQSHGIRINLTIVEVGSWTTTLPMMMAAQEKIDLMLLVPIPTLSFNTMTSQNQLMDITDLVDRHGPDLVKTVQAVIPAFLEGTKVNGRLYAVGGLFNKVNSYYYLARADLLDKYGIDIYSMRSMDDIEAALKLVQAGEPSLAPLVGQIEGGVTSYETPVGAFAGYTNMEAIGDNVSYVFLDNPWQVVNYFKTDVFRDRVYKARDWFLKGYIYRDAMINQEMPEELVKGNKGFSFFMDSELGIEAAKSAQIGKQVRAVNIHDNPLTTSLMVKFAWGVPSYSKEGEAAVKFLNLLYSRPDLSRLLIWGIEGRDYVIKADGTAAYPPGVTAQTVPYRQMDFLGANQYLVPPWEGNPPDLRATALKQNQTVPASPLLGFTYDTGPVSLEISSIINVVNEYGPGLNSGAVDPAVVLPRFIKALDDAGAEKLTAEAQRQLNAWKAAAGK